jgi:hypothetical protein
VSWRESKLGKWREPKRCASLDRLPRLPFLAGALRDAEKSATLPPDADG